MKKRIQRIPALAILVLCLTAIGLAADEVEVLSARNNFSWVTPRWRRFKKMDEFLAINGWVNIYTKDSFVVDPNAGYLLSGTFRTPASQPGLTCFKFGFEPIGVNNRSISPENIGNTPMWTSGNGAWDSSGHIRFLANPNGAFWSNRNPAACFNFGNEGEVMTLSLRNPRKRNSPAECMIRDRYYCRLSPGNRSKTAPYEWTKFTSTVKGLEMTGNCNNQWRYGMERARVFIVVSEEDATLEFRNVTVTKISE